MHSNDQILFATAGYDHTIRFWEPNTGSCYRVLNHDDSQVNCMAFSPDKRILATGGFQHVSLYDINSNNQKQIDGTIKNTVSIGFQEKGLWMYTAGEDKTVKLWDMKSRHNCIQALNHTHPINCAALHPNQIDFIIGDEAGNLLRWDIRHAQAQKLLTDKSAIRSLSINQDGNMLAFVNNDGFCYVRTLTGGFGNTSPHLGREVSFQAHRRYGLKCVFSPNSTLLATSSADGTAKVWLTVDFSLLTEGKDIKPVTECKDLKPKWVWDLAFTSDSEYLFTACSETSSRLWTVETGEIKRKYEGHQKPVICLAFSDTK